MNISAGVIVVDEEKQGALQFSPRETQVIKLTLEGLTLKEISGEIGCDVRTVHAYRRRAMQKSGARNLIDLVRRVGLGASEQGGSPSGGTGFQALGAHKEVASNAWKSGAGRGAL